MSNSHPEFDTGFEYKNELQSMVLNNYLKELILRIISQSFRRDKAIYFWVAEKAFISKEDRFIGKEIFCSPRCKIF